MIQYKIGDLCEALVNGEVIAIGHQANCFNTMNSGVAKAIRLKWPQVYTADCKTRKGDRGKLGGFSMECVNEFGKYTGFVFNLYGQYDYGYDAKGYTDYTALRQAMEAMRDDLSWMKRPVKIGFPKIGAGLGGGDWDTIARTIEEVFTGYDVTVYTLQ